MFFSLANYSGRNGNSQKWEEISRILTKTRKLRFKTSLELFAIYSGRNGNSQKWETTQNSLLEMSEMGSHLIGNVLYIHGNLALGNGPESTRTVLDEFSRNPTLGNG